jgi:hypothetical protein
MHRASYQDLSHITLSKAKPKAKPKKVKSKTPTTVIPVVVIARVHKPLLKLKSKS